MVTERNDPLKSWRILGLLLDQHEAYNPGIDRFERLDKVNWNHYLKSMKILVHGLRHYMVLCMI
jgi:hypothetical protein